MISRGPSINIIFPLYVNCFLFEQIICLLKALVSFTNLNRNLFQFNWVKKIKKKNKPLKYRFNPFLKKNFFSLFHKISLSHITQKYFESQK